MMQVLMVYMGLSLPNVGVRGRTRSHAASCPSLVDAIHSMTKKPRLSSSNMRALSLLLTLTLSIALSHSHRIKEHRY